MYQSYFGLVAKPFQLSPDPDFFFSSKGHKRALSYLQYGLGQGEGFIVVTGDVGTGKTTLMRNLLKNLNRETVIAAQLVTTKVESDDLLRLICSAFGMPAENKPKAILLQQFESFLRKAHQAKKRVLLIVDEAQNLPASAIEELRMLSNFQLTDSPLLQSFLLGQPELRDIIQDPSMEQFRQRIIASCHLQPLGEDELKQYILWRLSVAGWAQKPKFSDLSFGEIFKFTNGIPRKINIFCDRLLLFCFLEEATTVTKEIVMTVADELAEELAPPTTVNRASIVSQNAAENSGYSQPVAGLSVNSTILPDMDELQQKINLLNGYFNDSLDEKIQMMKVIDKKFKEKVISMAESTSVKSDLDKRSK